MRIGGLGAARISEHAIVSTAREVGARLVAVAARDRHRAAGLPLRPRSARGAVTGVPNDITRVLLLGRATHRRPALGELSGKDSAKTRREAAQVAAAFDAVLDEMDYSILRGAVSDGIGQVKDLTGAVVDFATDRFTRDDDETAAEPGAPVAEGADQVEGALRRPEVVRLMAEFDRRMDVRLAA